MSRSPSALPTPDASSVSSLVAPEGPSIQPADESSEAALAAGYSAASSSVDDVDAWDEEELEDDAVLQTDESTALIGSMAMHILIIVSLA
ncbi:MAG: hypothetical protein AAF802_06160, partial [Planctomycetota bacterium]